jgi:hypothetical protein
MTALGGCQFDFCHQVPPTTSGHTCPMSAEHTGVSSPPVTLPSMVSFTRSFIHSTLSITRLCPDGSGDLWMTQMGPATRSSWGQIHMSSHTKESLSLQGPVVRHSNPRSRPSKHSQEKVLHCAVFVQKASPTFPLPQRPHRCLPPATEHLDRPMQPHCFQGQPSKHLGDILHADSAPPIGCPSSQPFSKYSHRTPRSRVLSLDPLGLKSPTPGAPQGQGSPQSLVWPRYTHSQAPLLGLYPTSPTHFLSSPVAFDQEGFASFCSLPVLHLSGPRGPGSSP